MKIIHAPRACAILFNLLVNRGSAKPWLLPANICPIVPITYLKAGVPFEFVDISSATLHMDLDQVEARIRRRETGGILYAHTYGDESTPEDFFTSAKSIDPEILLVDDRCLCMPSFNEMTSADVVLFSTGYAKIVELNFGGYALLDDDVEYQSEQLEFEPAHLEDLENAYKSAVRNRSRFDYRDTDWLQSDDELMDWDSHRKQIEKGLVSSMRHRMEINEIYSSRLPGDIRLPEQYQTWRFNLRVRNKEEILTKIFGAGLFASSHYASLAGILADGHAPLAEALADGVLNLFNDHHFTPGMADRACDLILNAL